MNYAYAVDLCLFCAVPFGRIWIAGEQAIASPDVFPVVDGDSCWSRASTSLAPQFTNVAPRWCGRAGLAFGCLLFGFVSGLRHG